MFSKEKINDINIIPLKTGDDNRPFKYSQLFDHAFPNIFICAPVKSGKSTLISNILDYVASNKSIVRIFSCTASKDPVMLETIKKLKNNNIVVQTFNSLEHKNKNGDNYSDVLDMQLAQLNQWLSKEDNIKKYKKLKVQVPLVINIFDDFLRFLKTSKAVNSISTENRHYKMFNIFSAQKYEAILPLLRDNLYYLILFKGIGPDKIKTIYNERISNVTRDQFEQLYQDAINKPFAFLYVDLKNPGTFRQNFNYEYNF